MPPARTPKMGRPPTGPDGTRVSDYPRLTVRIPHETKRQLELLSTLRGIPAWKLIEDAIAAYVQQLPDGERRDVERLARQMAARDPG